MQSFKEFCRYVNEDNNLAQISKKLSTSNISTEDEEESSVEDKLSKINDNNIKQGLVNAYIKLKDQSGDSWNGIKSTIDSIINNIGVGLDNTKEIVNGYQKATKLKMEDMIYTMYVVSLNGIANKNQATLQSVGASMTNIPKCAAYCLMICNAIYCKNNGLNSIQILSAAGIK